MARQKKRPELPFECLIHWERKNRAHVLAGSRWRGHSLVNGADCRCESEVIIPQKRPRQRIFLHDENMKAAA